MIEIKDRRINYIRPLIMIVFGTLLLCSLFWIDLGCDNSLSAGQCSQEIHFDFLILGVPLVIFGVGFISVGLIKLNKYFKYKKLENTEK